MRYLLMTGLLLRANQSYLHSFGVSLFFTSLINNNNNNNKIMMTSRDNDIDKETLSESETSSNQDQGQGERCDRKGAGGGKPRTSNINKTDGVDSAASC